MTSRDRTWRAGGLVLFGTACAIGLADRAGGVPTAGGGVAGLVSFGLAIIGIVLLVQGKRVPISWQVERSRHRFLPLAIRARRSRRGPGEQAGERRA